MYNEKNSAAKKVESWRAGYARYLESKGLDKNAALSLAKKVEYRPDLYPDPDSKGANEPVQSPKFEDQKEILLSATAAPQKTRKTRDEKIIDTSAFIAGAGPDDADRAYMHSIMCQVGLPRSKVDGNSFERISGGAALLVESGKLWDGKQFVQQPIPYGATPRIMLAWMNTFALRNNSPEIPVGDSASEFLKMLGTHHITGGARGSFTMFKKQIQALSACRMTLGFNAHGKAHTYEGKPIKHFEAWINSDEQQRTFWPGIVTFSQDYFETLKDHAVPIDLRAFISLKGSALDLDVYIWLAQRLHRIEGRPVILYWTNLRNQFGQEYQGKEADKDFKKKFLPSLKRALAVYPEAKVKQVKGGIMLLSSPPPIPYKGNK